MHAEILPRHVSYAIALSKSGYKARQANPGFVNWDFRLDL
jgi:hypothetical protein